MRVFLSFLCHISLQMDNRRTVPPAAPYLIKPSADLAGNFRVENPISTA
jgi:hypothetical protein